MRFRSRSGGLGELFIGEKLKEQVGITRGPRQEVDTKGLKSQRALPRA